MSSLAPVAAFIAAISHHRMGFVNADNLVCIVNDASLQDKAADVQKSGPVGANFYCLVEAFGLLITRWEVSG